MIQEIVLYTITSYFFMWILYSSSELKDQNWRLIILLSPITAIIGSLGIIIGVIYFIVILPIIDKIRERESE